MSKPEQFGKIAFFVESEVDKVIIEILAKPLLSSAVYFRKFRMGKGNIAAFNIAYIEVLELLQKGYQHFFIVFDTNTTDEYEIARAESILIKPIKEESLLDYVTFCPIIPNINAWLQDHYELPQKEFGQEFDLPKIKEVASKIDINKLKQKNASFNQFAQVLQQWNVQKMAA